MTLIDDLATLPAAADSTAVLDGDEPRLCAGTPARPAREYEGVPMRAAKGKPGCGHPVVVAEHEACAGPVVICTHCDGPAAANLTTNP